MTTEQTECEGSCNPFIAPCGARFCTMEEMTHHQRECTKAVTREPQETTEDEFTPEQIDELTQDFKAFMQARYEPSSLARRACWCSSLRAAGASGDAKCPPCLAKENATLRSSLAAIQQEREELEIHNRNHCDKIMRMESALCNEKARLQTLRQQIENLEHQFTAADFGEGGQWLPPSETLVLLTDVLAVLGDPVSPDTETPK